MCILRHMKSLERPATPALRAFRQRTEKFPSALRASDASMLWAAVVTKGKGPARWSNFATALYLVRVPKCECVECVKCNDGNG